ncbi:Ubiquitin-protein ligase E3A [Wickerhamomyces ciferrii]|uniref:HECT-type E3 ubiquitin transferase n=1 Tax=Wickerhamomyces ciferrii (strain ATCC 14091 / BCRC 22168 / CBS 111 / JCM 3599 / NBRC 0793 / NRRL Y-1031 F-60-10) TaxID=1206466 RepID=K0K6S3_WICCF|nr:Ubiquitin-protein ligase E3A [Wickerhamomyces ciferrii]CCH40610.1 Ubiquitin-protein ligase E3A [Wickerhamomyces ciferrii]
MQNFNGQLKKRTVNLGGGFKNNRTNILLHTQREREKREKERAREKSVIIVQSFIRRHLALIRYKKHVALQWESLVGNQDINFIVRHFSLFYSTLYKINERKVQHIQTLSDLLTEENIKILDQNVHNELLNVLTRTLNQLNFDNQSDERVLEVILSLSDRLYPKQEIEPPKIINAFTRIIGLFSEQGHFDAANKLVVIITKYLPLETANYIKFLTLPNLDKLSNFVINFETLDKNITDSSVFSHLNEDEVLTVLTCFINSATTFDVHEISPISWALSSLQVTISTKSEDDFVQENEEDYQQDYGFESKKLRRKIIDDELNQKIEQLYNREFISAVTKNVKDSHILTRLYGSLIRLKPNLKSTFIIYMIPDSFENLVNSIIEHPLFKEFINMEETTIYSLPKDTLDNLFQPNLNFIQYDLYIFLEVFQYYLIVSNDYEIFKKYDFNSEKFEKIALFLKRFVLNLFWNQSKLLKSIPKFEAWGLLETLSVRVLNQVYLKDSRLSIVDKSIWLIPNNKVDILHLVTLITYYQERKEEIEDDSDTDVDTRIFSTLKADQKPLLKIFLRAPFFISFYKRVEIFQLLVDMDKDKEGLGDGAFFSLFTTRSRQWANIRRGHMLEDAYESFNTLGEAFKGPLKINFTNEHGQVEQGIDGGGLTKEFLTSTVKEGFKDLFVENDSHELYPNPQIGLKYQYRVESEEQLKSLNYLNFLGRIIGKCLYERVLVDINFSPFFLTKFNTGYKNSFDDLRSLDKDIYSNLVKLLNMNDEELESMNLTFTIDEQINNKNVSIDLIPNGSITQVNSSNKLKFIHEVSNFKLNKLINIQSNSFLNGLFGMISKEWLAMFNPYEVQMLISGEKDVDINDLKENVHYGNCEPTDLTVKYFWEVVEEMSNTDRFQLVKFVTSVPRAPLLGFKALNPRLGIFLDKSLGHRDALPSSATCTNMLRLPDYKDKKTLREKLIYAINSEAGFELT